MPVFRNPAERETMKYVIIIVAVVVGAIRVFINPSGHGLTLIDVYKDLAHVFIGSLIVPAWMGRKWVVTPEVGWYAGKENLLHSINGCMVRNYLYRWMFWLLCALEVIAATVNQMK